MHSEDGAGGGSGRPGYGTKREVVGADNYNSGGAFRRRFADSESKSEEPAGLYQAAIAVMN